MNRGRTRSTGPIAGIAVVAATTWLALLGHVLGRWPDRLVGVAVVAACALAVVAIAWLAGRRSVRERELRTAIAYVALAGAVGAAATATVFASVVVVLVGRPGRDATDEMRASLIAAVVTGLVLATLTRGINQWARRRAYGGDGPRRQLLDQFGQRLARNVSLDETLQQLVETIGPACAADAAELWLAEGSRLSLRYAEPARSTDPVDVDATRAAAIARAGVSGDRWADSWLPELRTPPGHLRIAPLAMQGELLGTLVARRTAPADDFDDADDDALARVVRLVSAALHNAALDAQLRRTVDELRRRNTELQRSRSRIVTAADDERRRLERDLHDGAQSHLMAIAVKVQLARGLADGQSAVLPVLDEIERDLDTANAQLRALAHGIFPPLLLTGGLADAIAGIAAHSPAAVTVGHVTRARFDPQIEAAVYFCCLEALQNAVKHAGPNTRVTVTVEDGDGVTLVVRDDGEGFDEQTTASGHGFTNMADRLGALGGVLHIDSHPGAGTTVRGHIPGAALVSATVQ